jgi:MFS family permease
MKERIEAAIKTAIYGSIAAAAGVAAFAFGAIALFFWTQQHYDTVVAAAAVGGLFLLVALIGLAALLVARHRAAKEKEAESERPVPQWLSEPATILAAVQIARTIGLGRLVPVILLGAVAAGFVLNPSASKRASRQRASSPEGRRAA